MSIENSDPLFVASQKLLHDMASPLMILAIMNETLETNIDNLLAGYEQALTAGLLPSENTVSDLDLVKNIAAQNQEAISRLDKLFKNFRSVTHEIKQRIKELHPV